MRLLVQQKGCMALTNQSVGLYLSNDLGELRFPIAPEKISVGTESDGEEYSIAELGVVNVPKPAFLDVIEYESYFPAEPSRYDDAPFRAPQDLIDLIVSMEKEKDGTKRPVRFIFVNGSFTINDLFTIEQFNYEQSFGIADVDFTIRLKQHVPFEPKQMKVVNPPNNSETTKVAENKAPERKQEPTPTTYSLIKGDSLWKVAQKYTGNGNNYPELAKLNGIKESDYRRLPIGLKLKIPTSWTEK